MKKLILLILMLSPIITRAQYWGHDPSSCSGKITCDVCYGMGHFYGNRCISCGGTGKINCAFCSGYRQGQKMAEEMKQRQLEQRQEEQRRQQEQEELLLREQMAANAQSYNFKVTDWDKNSGVFTIDMDYVKCGLSFGSKAKLKMLYSSSIWWLHLIVEGNTGARNIMNRIKEKTGKNEGSSSYIVLFSDGNKLPMKNRSVCAYNGDINTIEIELGLYDCDGIEPFINTDISSIVFSGGLDYSIIINRFPSSSIIKAMIRYAESVTTSSSSSSSSSKPSAASPQGYVNLGLPSGTLWKDTNERGFYDYDTAISKFGNKLPTKAQLQELMDKCSWTWTGSGCKVVGPNGKSIVPPAAGFRPCNGIVNDVGSTGFYRSSTSDGFEAVWVLAFESDELDLGSCYRCNEASVRLVHNP